MQTNVQTNVRRGSLPFISLVLLAFLLGVLLLGALLVGGCERATPSPPDILLVTVDTLRRDHLGLYGYPRPTSPNIDRWFGDAILFDRAYSAEGATSPSVISFLSGKLPQDHGVRVFYQLIPDTTLVISDHLRAAGYQTAGVVSNIVLTDEAIGLASRFDHFDDYVDERESWRAVWERNARRTTDAALEWLREGRTPDRPHFLWVHYIDPHGPYAPPPDRPVDFSHPRSRPFDINKMHSYMRVSGVRDGLEYVDRYDEEIAYCDQQIGRLLDGYRDLGLADEAIIAFTADHGETMLEHEWFFAHQYHVYESIIRVPLALRVPGHAARVIGRPASLIELAPTLLQLAGLDIPPDMRRSGVLLDEEPRDIFSEATTYSGDKHWRAMVRGDDKWIISLGRPGAEELWHWRFQVGLDPAELLPLPWADGDSARARPLYDKIATDFAPAGRPPEMHHGHPIKGPKVRPDVGPEVMEKLRALGYVK